MKRTPIFYVMLIGFFLGMPVVLWADTLTCTLIDNDFPGASGTNAYGINNAGDIAGIVDDGTGRHGYKKSGGVVTAIRHPGGTTYVNSINDLGQVVGFVQSGGNHGFVTSDDGATFTPINDPNAQDPNGTIPFGINNSGQIVGLFVSVSGSNFSHGFLTNDGVTFTTIDIPNASSTAADGINDAGEIVGHFADATGGLHGFLRSVNGTITTFDFPVAGVIHTVAYDINNMGQIAGYFVDATGVHGFLKDGTTFTALDCQGAVTTRIFGINDTGQITGTYFDGTRDHGFTATIPSPQNELTSLGQAAVWIGLKNSDDQGTQFDLKADVSLHNSPVASSQTLCITGVTRNPDKAKKVLIQFTSFSPVSFASGDLLSLTISTRIGTNPDTTKCPGHNNAVGLRLYYDSISRSSQIGVELTPDPLEDFFLHVNDFLDEVAPTATTTTFKDSASINFAGGNLWKAIGTWSMVLP